MMPQRGKNKSKGKANNPFGSPSSRITLLRILVACTLLVMAIVGGYFSFSLLSESEKELAKSRFDAIASQGLDSFRRNIIRSNDGIITLRNIYRHQSGNISEWPNVILPGYFESVTALSRASSITDIALAPIVVPENIPSFEQFMFNYWDNEPRIPASAGYRAFGRGIHSLDPSIEGVGKAYHDVTGETLYYNSTYTITTPVIQGLFSEYRSADELAGLNLHHAPHLGRVIDAMLDCVAVSNYSSIQENNYCGQLSDVSSVPFISLSDPDPEAEEMQSIIVQPIVLPSTGDNDNTAPPQVVGIITGALGWSTVFDNSWPRDVSGIDIVVKTDSSTFTYEIESGTPLFKSLRDEHDSNYDSDVVSMQLLGNWEDVHIWSNNYKVYIYPTREFYAEFESNEPFAVTACFMALIIFCTIVFMVYDRAVGKEATRKDVVLDGKKRFVRFISHEIRTPLNTVRLGLHLFELELKALSTDIRTALHDIEDARLNGSSKSQRTMTTTALQTTSETLQNWIVLVNDSLGNSEAAVDVLNDLLNFDKIETGSMKLEFSYVSIWDAVRSSYTSFVMQAKQKTIKYRLHGRCYELDLQPDEVEEFRKLKVVGDVTRIAQIMRNFTSNALKFTPENGSVTITVTYKPNGLECAEKLIKMEGNDEDEKEMLENPRAGSVVIAVTDSGAGLSEDQLGKIGGEGVQFNANALQAGGGSGLGLYITKGLVDYHGGRFDVTSPGLTLGATFSVELPLFRVLSAEEEKKEEEGASESLKASIEKATVNAAHPSKGNAVDNEDQQNEMTSSVEENSLRDSIDPMDKAERIPCENEDRRPAPEDFMKQLSHPIFGPIVTDYRLSDRPKRILLVDDALSTRKLLMRIFKAKGYLCHEAENGAKAIELYESLYQKREEVDAIIMDWEMPVLDGPTAVRKIREMGSECFIVGVTGNVSQEDINHFKEHGATTVLAKPLNIDAFESLLARYKPKNYHMHLAQSVLKLQRVSNAFVERGKSAQLMRELSAKLPAEFVKGKLKTMPTLSSNAAKVYVASKDLSSVSGGAEVGSDKVENDNHDTKGPGVTKQRQASISIPIPFEFGELANSKDSEQNEHMSSVAMIPSPTGSLHPPLAHEQSFDELSIV